MRLAIPNVEMTRRADGATLLRTAQPLGPYDRAVGDWLVRWSEHAPFRQFLAERAGLEWRTITYGDALDSVRRVGESLLARGLTAATPIAILSDNSINHALLALGAMHAGIPAVPISPAYSLLSSDHTRLKQIVALLQPGLVFAEDAERFAPALAAIGATATPFEALLEHRPSARIDAAFAAIDGDTIAKVLFTSGSTGTPKGVINTHRMLCSAQQSWAQLWPFLEDTPPILCDWLPWNHTAGGNAGFNLALRNGGTLFIDGGRPTPALIDVTVRNISDVEPTLYLSVPRGFDVLLPRLAADAPARRSFFSRLDAMYYTGAALPPSVWQRLTEMAAAEGRSGLYMLAGWGSTEMTLGTRVHFRIEQARNVGSPGPGVELKLVPVGDRQEARLRGLNVTPGYFRAPELTREAFDEEGFLKSGDALRLADENNPSKGLLFDGRVSEDFKLLSGTWVHVGAIRVALITACHPLVQDAVITGHDRHEIGALIFLSESAVRTLGLDADTVRQRLRESLVSMRAAATGSSTVPARLLVLEEPPSLDHSEITDKGYVNQRAVLRRRAADVEALHAGSPGTIVA